MRYKIVYRVCRYWFWGLYIIIALYFLLHRLSNIICIQGISYWLKNSINAGRNGYVFPIFLLNQFSGTLFFSVLLTGNFFDFFFLAFIFSHQFCDCFVETNCFGRRIALPWSIDLGNHRSEVYSTMLCRVAEKFK